MSGLCDTCKVKPRCISPEGGMQACSLYEQDCKSNWFELFGTPERAARTLMGICDECEEGMCSGCKIDPLMGYATNDNALLEWLRGDA